MTDDPPYADADLNCAIVRGCLRRELTMDFLSAGGANLSGVPDPRVLALAAEQDRIVVSHDFQTMPRTSLISSRLMAPVLA